MALKNDKNDIFTTIGSYSSFMQQKKNDTLFNKFNSINNKNDVFSFLFDILRIIVGTEGLKIVIGEIFSKLIDEIEPKMKIVLKKQLTQSNSDLQLPNYFVNDGQNVIIKNIDTNNKYKTNPNSDIGMLLYNTNDPNFDTVVYDSISNPNTYKTYGNISILYDENADILNIKPNSPETISSFFYTYIDNTKILNKNELLSNIFDSIFGTIKKNKNKTKEQILKEIEVEKILEKLIENPTQDDLANDSLLLSDKDKKELRNIAENLKNGYYYYDFGCGILESELLLNNLDSLIKSISGSTDSNFISNEIENIIYKSANVDNSEINNYTINKNKETVKDNFFEKIIKKFILKILESFIVKPEIRMLLTLSSSFQNNGNTLIGDVTKDLDVFKIFVNCITKEIKNIISEFLFKFAVSKLTELLLPIMKKIAKEKINQYINIIKSLINI